MKVVIEEKEEVDWEKYYRPELGAIFSKVNTDL